MRQWCLSGFSFYAINVKSIFYLYRVNRAKIKSDWLLKQIYRFVQFIWVEVIWNCFFLHSYNRTNFLNIHSFADNKNFHNSLFICLQSNACSIGHLDIICVISWEIFHDSKERHKTFLYKQKMNWFLLF